MGMSELGILGVIALIFFGGSKLGGMKDKKKASREKETNPMASFQNNNSDFDNTPVGKPEESKS